MKVQSTGHLGLPSGQPAMLEIGWPVWCGFLVLMGPLGSLTWLRLILTTIEHVLLHWCPFQVHEKHHKTFFVPIFFENHLIVGYNVHCCFTDGRSSSTMLSLVCNIELDRQWCMITSIKKCSFMLACQFM